MKAELAPFFIVAQIEVNLNGVLYSVFTLSYLMARLTWFRLNLDGDDLCRFDARDR